MRRCPVKRKDDTKIFAKFTGKHFFRSLFFNKIADWKPETPIRSHYRCSEKQSTLKSFANFTGKNVCWNIFLIKLQFWGPATLLKKTLTEVFSCEIRKIFKNNYFEEHLWVSTSKRYWKLQHRVFPVNFVNYSRTPIFLFADQWSFQFKISLLGGTMVN